MAVTPGFEGAFCPVDREGIRYLLRPPHIAAGALFLWMLAPAAAAAATHPLDQPSRSWRNGPARYLMTRREGLTFKKLPDDAARAEFIVTFWKRRDPTPETERNEFYEEFWDRVDRTESLRLYYDTTKALWLTDMGKTYILLGPPFDETKNTVSASTRDTIIWEYHSVPGVLDPHFSVAFVKDTTGELRLSSSPAQDQSTAQGLAAHTPAALMGPTADVQTTITNALAGLAFVGDPLLSSLGTSSATTVDRRIADLASYQNEAINYTAPTTEVRVQTSFEEVPLDVQPDFYRADDGTTYAAFTLGPGKLSNPGELIPFGGIISLDDPGISYPLSLAEQFAAAGPEAPHTFQTGLGIDPGRYRVLFGMQEKGTGRVGTWQQDLTVPDLTAGQLSLSSLTLARSLDPVETQSSSLKVPYILGKLRVVPRTDRTLRNGEEFHLYYQIYGAREGEDGDLVLDLTYRFQGNTGAEWVDLGDPIEQTGMTGAVQAWSFPLQGWPPGEFRILVHVRDKNSGYPAEGRLTFRVRE